MGLFYGLTSVYIDKKPSYQPDLIDDQNTDFLT